MEDPTKSVIEIQKASRELAEAMRHAGSENIQEVLNSCRMIKSNLSIIKAWAKERKS